MSGRFPTNRRSLKFSITESRTCLLLGLGSLSGVRKKTHVLGSSGGGVCCKHTTASSFYSLLKTKIFCVIFCQSQFSFFLSITQNFVLRLQFIKTEEEEKGEKTKKSLISQGFTFYTKQNVTWCRAHSIPM